jgi:hypothetical protein
MSSPVPTNPQPVTTNTAHTPAAMHANQHPQSPHTAPNTRRPWYRRTRTRAAAVILTGGLLIATDAIHAAADPDTALVHGALALSAFALIAKGCLQIKPRYRHPANTAARMD